MIKYNIKIPMCHILCHYFCYLEFRKIQIVFQVQGCIFVVRVYQSTFRNFSILEL